MKSSSAEATLDHVSDNHIIDEIINESNVVRPVPTHFHPNPRHLKNQNTAKITSSTSTTAHHSSKTYSSSNGNSNSHNDGHRSNSNSASLFAPITPRPIESNKTNLFYQSFNVYGGSFSIYNHNGNGNQTRSNQFQNNNAQSSSSQQQQQQQNNVFQPSFFHRQHPINNSNNNNQHQYYHNLPNNISSPPSSFSSFTPIRRNNDIPSHTNQGQNPFTTPISTTHFTSSSTTPSVVRISPFEPIVNDRKWPNKSNGKISPLPLEEYYHWLKKRDVERHERNNSARSSSSGDCKRNEQQQMQGERQWNNQCRDNNDSSCSETLKGMDEQDHEDQTDAEEKLNHDDDDASNNNNDDNVGYLFRPVTISPWKEEQENGEDGEKFEIKSDYLKTNFNGNGDSDDKVEEMLVDKREVVVDEEQMMINDCDMEGRQEVFENKIDYIGKKEGNRLLRYDKNFLKKRQIDMMNHTTRTFNRTRSYSTKATVTQEDEVEVTMELSSDDDDDNGRDEQYNYDIALKKKMRKL